MSTSLTPGIGLHPEAGVVFEHVAHPRRRGQGCHGILISTRWPQSAERLLRAPSQA
jgi:hypothetical protein